MKNAEKYKDQILDLCERGNRPAVKNGKVVKCSETLCNDCDFEIFKCAVDTIMWLYKEAEEKPVLTTRQYCLLKSLPDSARVRRSKNAGMEIEYRQTETLISEVIIDKVFPDLPIEKDLWYEVADILEWDVKLQGEDLKAGGITK